MSESQTDHTMFSVVIPVYNCEAFLHEAIQSVLDQTHVCHEILVIDDGSTDASAKIAQSYSGVKTVSCENGGVAKARNTGIDHSTTSVIAFLDADDIWAKNKLAEYAKLFSKADAPDYAISKSTLFLTDSGIRPSWCRPSLLDKPFVDYCPSSLVVRRSAFDRIGNFNESIRISNDLEWLSRAQDANLICAVIEKELQQRRVHEQNLTSNVDEIHSELLSMIASKLAKKRQLI